MTGPPSSSLFIRQIPNHGRYAAVRAHDEPEDSWVGPAWQRHSIDQLAAPRHDLLLLRVTVCLHHEWRRMMPHDQVACFEDQA